jgi:flippase wzx
MNSLRSNFLYNIFLTIGSQLMALIVFPYVSRVLGPSNFGAVNFIDATADNFIILATMGMTTLGVREIVINRNNPIALSATFSSLFLLNTISTGVALALMMCAYLFLPNLSCYPEMMLVACAKVIFSFLQINWLFAGLEQFKFISLRTLAIKVLYVIGVFVFVRNTDDYNIYFILLVGMTAANAIANLYYSRRFVRLKFSEAHWRPYVAPFFFLGLYMICTCIYNTLNMMILGVLSTTDQVGYFSFSAKLFAIITGIYYAFTSAAMPRMCSLLVDEKTKEFSSYITRTSRTVTQLAIPIIIFGIIFASQITYVVSGPQYDAAVPSMRILFPMLYFLGMEKILIEQILMPLKRDRLLLRNAMIAAGVAIACDILFVDSLGATGCAIAWLSAEFTIFTLSITSTSKYLTFADLAKEAKTTVLYYLPLIPVLILVTYLRINPGWIFAIGAVVFTVYFICLQYYFVRNSDILNFLHLTHEKKISSQE